MRNNVEKSQDKLESYLDTNTGILQVTLCKDLRGEYI